MQLIEIGTLFMMLRLSFGRKPCPCEWGTISETIGNLANTILYNDGWDLDNLSAPNQHLAPEQTLLNGDIPFSQGTELIVDIPIDLMQQWGCALCRNLLGGRY